MPTSSNHTEVSVHCCHGKHNVASSRTLLSDQVYWRSKMTNFIEIRKLSENKNCCRRGTTSLGVQPFHFCKTDVSIYVIRERLCPASDTEQCILSRVLVRQEVINGFSGLTYRFIGQSPVATTNTYNTSNCYCTNNTQSLQHFHS
jgi:hypothetical protein